MRDAFDRGTDLRIDLLLPVVEAVLGLIDPLAEVLERALLDDRFVRLGGRRVGRFGLLRWRISSRRCWRWTGSSSTERPRETMQLRNQDLVYSVGLIDYLRDDLVIKLLDWIYDRLCPGGTAMVGNFDVGNPNKTFMDHVLDWKLFHRRAQDLVNLSARSKFGAVPVEVRFESTGINLFALAMRPD